MPIRASWMRTGRPILGKDDSSHSVCEQRMQRMLRRKARLAPVGTRRKQHTRVNNFDATIGTLKDIFGMR